MTIHDITMTVEPGMPVWPGDSRFGFDWTMRMSGGDSVNVTRLTMSPHTGTHADSFFHVANDALAMSAMPLEAYIGPARVLDAPGDGPIDIARLEGLSWKGATRLLFKTRRSRVKEPYSVPFAHLTPEAVALMGPANIRLVGLDTPSMDEFHSKTLDAHLALVKAGIANLENLDLTDVPAGDYELIALPLKLMGLDGSPVRAILRSLA